MARQVRGNFATYALSAESAFPSDEEVVAQACENMFTMCGNAGQEAMIGDHLADFDEWALEVLEIESASRGTTWEDFADMVLNDWYNGRADMWRGTEQIWAEGWIAIAEQSGYHDSRDEYGEGTGEEFW